MVPFVPTRLVTSKVREQPFGDSIIPRLEEHVRHLEVLYLSLPYMYRNTTRGSR